MRNVKNYGNMGHNKQTYRGKRDVEISIPNGGNKKAKKGKEVRKRYWTDKYRRNMANTTTNSILVTLMPK